MDILIDVNIALDVCTGRAPHDECSAAAMLQCSNNGGRLWLYVGSVQTLEYNLFRELKRSFASAPTQPSNRQLIVQSRALLKAFTADKHWLAALADEGPVFESVDPEDEQLFRALSRFSPGSIKLLTRDELLCGRHPEQTITPQQYLQTPSPQKTIDFIDLKKQQDLLRPQLEKNIHRVLHHGKYIMGPEIKELETRLAEYVGVKHCITVASGTDSLEIALRALGVGPGDEVITVPFTWISTAEVICQVGARPVFIDIDPATYNMNVDLLEAAITPQTKAILPVSLFGQMPDYEKINAIAARHGNIPVIEDGAQSFGSTQRGRRSCGVTTIGSTSFFPAKPFGCYGDGGALFTNDDQLAEKMRAIRTHGGVKRHHHPFIGMNGRLDTIQAAILLAKLDHFDWEVQQRNKIGARYTKLLNSALSPEASAPGVTPPYIAEANTSTYAQYTVRAQNRDALAAHLKELGVPAAVYYPKCLHEQPAFSFCGYKYGNFPEAEKASREVLSLPMHPYLAQVDQERVINAIQTAFCSAVTEES